jgi:two-component system response regulator
MEPKTRTKPAEILLIEDNPGDVELTRNAFDNTRFSNRMTVASSGEEALQILARQGKHTDAPRPDLILMDINLPQKSGIEVLTEIRQNVSLKDIPVIMLTSSKTNSDILDSAALKANGYMVKPISIEKLGRALSSLDGFNFVLVVSRSDKQ